MKKLKKQGFQGSQALNVNSAVECARNYKWYERQLQCTFL